MVRRDMSASRISHFGWYARRAAAMSPAEMAWRARDQALQVLVVAAAGEAGAARCGCAAVAG